MRAKLKRKKMEYKKMGRREKQLDNYDLEINELFQD